MAGDPTTAQVRAAARATYAVFIAAGFAFATWASRIPTVRDHLGLNPDQLGLVLLSIAAGSVVSLPITGWLIHRVGTRAAVAGTAALLCVGLVVVGIGYFVGVALVVVGLFLQGFGNGAWDVAMNVQGAAVERRIGRAIMPRFHAGFSFGTVVGALVGASMEALHVPVVVHFGAAAVVAVTTVFVAVRHFLADDHEADHEADPDRTDTDRTDTDRATEATSFRAAGVFTRWREPRTVLIGFFVLAFAFAEGTGNDWISIGLIDGYHVRTAVGTLGYATFLAAMTMARWTGPALLDRFGRVAVVRVLAAVAVAGLLLFVFGRATPVAYVGALLWGTGVSLCFPVGMSAAADEPRAAAARVSVVASIGYCAFLGGPPLIGFLAARAGVLHAFVAVAVLVTVAAGLAGSLRPPGPVDGQDARTRRRVANLPG
ncbi:MFS transporter [Jatrophihabitans endophyticus]|uniref:MFS transporter n=1 Tax=Jatrophihabitans endophyticus TaxID=1206085 RepID=UPI001A026B16|nr:MFS transporter [Jatrophihabitans endophyticus]MBE7188911.1 MFS transporter [Jatrophihabitans endophyticus]